MLATIISSWPPFKGISLYTQSLVSALASQGEVEVISFRKLYPEIVYPGGTRDITCEPAEITNVSVRPSLTWYNPFTWIRAGLVARGDVIHLQWWTYVLAPVYVTVILAARCRRKKIVITVHNARPHEGGWLLRWMNTAVVRLADHVIVHNESMKRSYIGTFHFPETKVSVIPHGLLPLMPAGISRAQARTELGIKESQKALLFFGAIREYKGLAVLIQAMSELVHRFHRSDMILIIAGQPWGDWDRYKKQISDSQISDMVKTYPHFIPANEAEKYFLACDVVVLPYQEFDAQSGVAALAVSAGKPIITSRAGGLSELAPDDSFVFATGDAHDLAQAIIRTLDNPRVPDKVAVAYQKFSRKYSWSEIAGQTFEVYKRLSP